MEETDGIRILVIEDEPYVRRIIMQILNRLKIEKIYEAEEGGEGFKQALRLKPDLILCDIHMEPVNGMKFLASLRKVKKPEIANIPVIFLTSDSNESAVAKARELNISGYMVKPVSVNDMKKWIERVLNVELKL